MSLLLEALKKAELAKQEAGGTATADTPTQAQPARSIITRANLPDITQPLEILSEDLAAPANPEPAYELRLEQPDDPPPPPVSEPAVTPTAQRQTAARQMFEVKDLGDYNPRKPFYYTLGALGLFAIGTVIYFWWQLQPHYAVLTPVVTEAPARPVSPAPPIAATPPVAPVATPQTAQAPTPGMMPTPAVRPDTAPAASRLTFARPTPATREGGSRAPVTVSAATLQIDPTLERAYEAYQAGDLVTARQAYQQTLKSAPDNRDALLGMAAIEVRNGQYESAEARYLRLLEADPRDAHAQAGLISLRGQANPAQSESRLKTLIADRPDNSQLHFALGNQLALQARWPEAQQAYFKAYSAEPDNADYAYNVAVSLDQMRQRKPAFEFYQKAVALAVTRPAAFDRTLAVARMRELQQ